LVIEMEIELVHVLDSCLATEMVHQLV
jgi:hypothetical protein